MIFLTFIISNLYLFNESKMSVSSKSSAKVKNYHEDSVRRDLHSYSEFVAELNTKVARIFTTIYQS